MVIDVSWKAIADGQVDADSPGNQILFQAIKDNLYHLELWLGKSYAAANDHDHDGVNSALAVLGTGQVTTPKLATDGVTLEKIQHYTVQALPSDYEEGALHTVTANGYVTKCTFKIYIPSDATTLGAIFNCKVTGGSTSNVRFSSLGSPSSVYNVVNTSFAWTNAMTLDVSGQAGWGDLEIEMDGDGSATLSIQGYQFYWL
jgi:hypothetical protein